MTRGRWILGVLVASSLIGGVLAYKRWPHLLTKLRKQPQVTQTAADQPLSIPPFSTLEPERYQATRVISEIEKLADGTLSQPSIERFVIARDGLNRREEFRIHEVLLVYLENAAGRFVLLPDEKIYAPADLVNESISNSPENEITDSSPDRLLHETSATAMYQKLGSESLEGRATTKYRVDENSIGTQAAETMVHIWVDDALGLPVKTEISSNSTIMTIELKNISREVDPQLFELPKDYKQVASGSVFKQKSSQTSEKAEPDGKSKTP